ncbi:MAG: glycoside hydrolase family 75 protein [Verrucomicrobiota bacterium]|nr:glycoside hydrolase family 75 protein [Verrucomicrobiota bacterium]
MERTLAIVFVALLSGLFDRCSRRTETPPEPSPAPEITPSPAKSPPMVYVPSKRMETAKLFNGIEVHATVDTEFGETATKERSSSSSYALELQVKVKAPVANKTLDEIRRLNPDLPAVLTGLETMLAAAKVSPFFENLYRLKIGVIQQNLVRLDALPSRHNFYDCETILELQDAKTKRRALLVQADMDVDMDGSDGDRVPVMEAGWTTFQPMTSYMWTKTTTTPNPFLAAREEKLKQLEATAKNGAGAQAEARAAIPAVRYEVNEMKKNSFLVSNADPYIALPSSMFPRNGDALAPKLGDFCVVIFKKTIYPAIIGDVGPSYKIGEASLRLSKQINAAATANNRPVSDLKVTYLIFPDTAEKPFAAPDLEKWNRRCAELLTELGGYKGELFAWEDITKPSPTPTPSPSVSPSADVSAAPSVSAVQSSASPSP